MNNPNMKRDAEELYRLLKAGSLESEKIVHAVTMIGKARLIEAESLLVQLLNDPDEFTRQQTLIVLGMDLDFTQYGPIAIEMMESDPDRDCRRAAAMCVGNAYHQTQDRQVLKRLANVVRSRDNDDVRGFAYKAIFNVLGNMTKVITIGTIHFPSDGSLPAKVDGGLLKAIEEDGHLEPWRVK